MEVFGAVLDILEILSPRTFRKVVYPGMCVSLPLVLTCQGRKYSSQIICIGLLVGNSLVWALGNCQHRSKRPYQNERHTSYNLRLLSLRDTLPPCSPGPSRVYRHAAVSLCGDTLKSAM